MSISHSHLWVILGGIGIAWGQWTYATLPCSFLINWLLPIVRIYDLVDNCWHLVNCWARHWFLTQWCQFFAILSIIKIVDSFGMITTLNLLFVEVYIVPTLLARYLYHNLFIYSVFIGWNQWHIHLGKNRHLYSGLIFNCWSFYWLFDVRSRVFCIVLADNTWSFSLRRISHVGCFSCVFYVLLIMFVWFHDTVHDQK